MQKETRTPSSQEGQPGPRLLCVPLATLPHAHLSNREKKAKYFSLKPCCPRHWGLRWGTCEPCRWRPAWATAARVCPREKSYPCAHTHAPAPHSDRNTSNGLGTVSGARPPAEARGLEGMIS